MTTLGDGSDLQRTGNLTEEQFHALIAPDQEFE